MIWQAVQDAPGQDIIYSEVSGADRGKCRHDIPGKIYDMENSIICRRCGRELTEQDISLGFCPVCGEPVHLEAEAEPAEPPEAETAAPEQEQSAGERIFWRLEGDFAVCPLCEASYDAAALPEQCERCGVLPEHTGDIWVLPQPEAAVLLVHAASGQEILPADGLRLGRHHTDCLRDDMYVSRLHAVLLVRDGEVMVRDEGSSNGTFVNGSRLEAGKEHPLSAGDSLALDEQIFLVQAAKETADKETAK